MRSAPLRLTATGAALLAALGGCGGSSTEIGDLPADAVFLTAVDRSTDISTARISYESTTRKDGEVRYASRGEGVFAPGALSFTSTMGEFDAEDEVPADRYFEVRLVDGAAYIRMPELMLGMAEEGSPTWIALSDDEADEMTAQLDQLDFGATLQALRDSAEVTEDGRETIAGVATTRYVGTTTLRSLLLAQGSTEEQLEQQQQFDGDDSDLDDAMPLTVWIDDEGLVRRFDYTTGGDDGFEFIQSMTVLEYGLEVDIVAPPAEETMSAEEFEALQDQNAASFESEFDVDELESDGMIVLESEGSATAEGTSTAERTSTPESAPAPAPEATTDSDG